MPDAFEIKFTDDAKSDIASLDGSIKTQLKKALLKKLAVNPLDYGTSLRAPLVGYYKHEFAAHRIIYRIYPQRGLVVVCAVGRRKQGDAAEVYEQLAKLVKSGRLAAQVLGTLQTPPDPNAKTKK